MTHRRIIIIFCLAGCAAGIVLWLSKDPPATRDITAAPGPSSLPAVETRLVARVSEQLAQPTSRPESLRILRELKAQLISRPRAEALAIIRDFLATGSDRPTGLSFDIGEGGVLTEWPTLRIFLLEILPSIDAIAAAEISRTILAAPTQPDEWAVALRNVALSDPSPGQHEWLRGRTEILINHPPWQAAPSIGYLNAFDVLVHINATRSIPLLSHLIQRKDRKDLAHAGFLTLNALVLRNPLEALTLISADADLQQSRPEMTAQQFARADLRDPSQQALIKRWLLDPRRNGTELRAFSGVYPNNNHFVSHNLLTNVNLVSGRNIAEHDPAAIKILRGWKQSPEFEPVKSYLNTMLSRLEAFAGKPAPRVPAATEQ